MKMKKILKKLLIVGCDVTIGYITYLILKARAFRKSCDINKNTLDVVSLFQNLNVDYSSQPIRDFKIGCFIGTVKCDLSRFVFDHSLTDITVIIEQGIVTLYIPKQVNVTVVSNTLGLNNILNYHKNSQQNKSQLIINTNIKFGLLIIRTCDD